MMMMMMSFITCYFSSQLLQGKDLSPSLNEWKNEWSKGKVHVYSAKIAAYSALGALLSQTEPA